MRVSALFAALGLLGAQQLTSSAADAPQGDDVAAFLENLRGPAGRRVELDALFLSANASLSGGRYSEAEETFRSLMTKEQLDARGLEGVARVYLAQDRKYEALEFLQAEVAHNPTRQDILFAFVRTAVKVNEYDLALATLAKALDGLADVRRRGDVYTRMGEVYRLKADLGSSIAAFRKAKALLPDNRIVAIELAQVLDVYGQEAEAVETYRAVLGVDPQDGAALLQRAWALSTGRNGSLDVATVCAQLARELLPGDPKGSDTLGWIYLKNGMPERAIPLYKELLTQAFEVSTYHYHLAMALLQTGDTAGGASELQAALKFNPPDDEKEHIQTLIAIGAVRK
jgi:tetratricopeptide (TPR) repeat protein